MDWQGEAQFGMFFDYFRESIVTELHAAAGRIGFHGVRAGRPFSGEQQMSAIAYLEHLNGLERSTATVLSRVEEQLRSADGALAVARKRHLAAVQRASMERSLRDVRWFSEHGEGALDQSELSDLEACFKMCESSVLEVSDLGRAVAEAQGRVYVYEWRKARERVRVRYIREQRELVSGVLGLVSHLT